MSQMDCLTAHDNTHVAMSGPSVMVLKAAQGASSDRLAAAIRWNIPNGLIYCGTSSSGDSIVDTTPGRQALYGIAAVGPYFEK